MSFNLTKEIDKITASLTNSVATKAKDSAISTLKDPEFKATVSQFTKDWFSDNKHIIIPIVGSFLILSLLAISNILTNLRVRR